MTIELEAVVGCAVPRETIDKLLRFESMVRYETTQQNLVSKSTIDDFWARHVLDSAQLVGLARGAAGPWADIGSGAGLPGIVLACLIDQPIDLIEPRRLRAEFLERVVKELGINASVIQSKAERVRGKYGVVTARAVASLDSLLELSSHLSTGKTLHLYPKGRNAQTELLHALRRWQGTFHVEPSATDADSLIVVARDVRPRE